LEIQGTFSNKHTSVLTERNKKTSNRATTPVQRQERAGSGKPGFQRRTRQIENDLDPTIENDWKKRRDKVEGDRRDVLGVAYVKKGLLRPDHVEVIKILGTAVLFSKKNWIKKRSDATRSGRRTIP